MDRGMRLPNIALGAFVVMAAAFANASHGAPLLNSSDRLPSEVAWGWFELLYDIVKAEQTPPPQASRIYGIASVALYESATPGSDKHRSLAGQLNGLTSLPRPERHRQLYWPAVANAAFAATVRGLYVNLSSASLNATYELEAQFTEKYRARISGPVLERSTNFGRQLAAGILAWAAGDLYSVHNNCPYVPATEGPSAWKPTPPAFNPNPLQPCWGLIRPMVLNSSDECRVERPPQYSVAEGSRFREAALEVYLSNLSLSPEQKTIADYWADAAGATGTPPGHWIAIVSQIARRDGLSLADAAEAFARVGLAVHDAFIACWREKYESNLLRPVTYINDHIDQVWRPYIVTPNFPSYTSGHSTQSAAAAHALTAMFGVRRLRDTTHADHGLIPAQQPRTFASFEAAAEEAAVSRLYGGIHYSFDNESGLVAGSCVGRALSERVRFRRERNH